VTNANRRTVAWFVIAMAAVVASLVVAFGSRVDSSAAAAAPASTESPDAAQASLQTDVASAVSLNNTDGTGLAPSIAAGERAIEFSGTPLYVNEFSDPDDFDRLDHFVHYRDPFVVTHTTGSSDHAKAGGVNCSAPEQTRPQHKDEPEEHVYMCFPGGDPSLGHAMAYAMDSSGYGFVGSLPDQVFENVDEVSLDINTTSAGARNFVEIKVIPADKTFVNGMPCGPDLPCNDGWDYNDIDGVGGITFSQEGVGLQIATADRPDGETFDFYSSSTDSRGTHYESCDNDSSGHCFTARLHVGNQDIRQRHRHVFRDNNNGTISFGVAEADGSMHWVTAEGAFPSGPVRVVIAFHNYTGTKSGNGPGNDGNLSPSTGGFTWHWDNLVVYAESTTPSVDYFGGLSADRIVTADGCVTFSQGQRGTPHHTDIAPEFHCS